MSRRSLRQMPRFSYCEHEEPNIDEYIFCDKCGDDVYEYCSIHGPLLVILDDKIPAVSPYPPIVPRSALSVPKEFLHLNYSSIPGAGLGVFASVRLGVGARFGPYRGRRTLALASDYCWQMHDARGAPAHLLDAADADRSNWMRFVNCARHSREQNLLAFQFRGHLYYRTIKVIPQYTELLVFYGSDFAKKLNIDLKNYNSPTPFTQKSENDKKRDNEETGAQTKIVPNYNKGKVQRERKTTKITRKILPEMRKSIAENNQNQHSKNASRNQTTDTKAISHKSYFPKSTQARKPKIQNTNKNVAVNDSSTHNSNLADVNKVNNLKNVQNFFCSMCDYQNIQKDAIENHMRFHDTDRKFVCSKCNYRFETSTVLNDHLKTHTGEKPYACDKCNYRCTQAGTLKTHLRTHTGEKPYACDICNYRCTEAGTLKTHLRTHTGEKPYACDICNYRCTEAGTLKTHLRTHTGEKPYACDICSYTCTQAGNLKTHLRTHTGEKPYACDICSYTCTQAGNLKTHLRTHTGEKPYACDICSYTYTQAGNLKKHLLRIHLKQP